MESVLEQLEQELDDLVQTTYPKSLFDDPITVERVESIKNLISSIQTI